MRQKKKQQNRPQTLTIETEKTVQTLADRLIPVFMCACLLISTVLILSEYSALLAGWKFLVGGSGLLLSAIYYLAGTSRRRRGDITAFYIGAGLLAAVFSYRSLLNNLKHLINDVLDTIGSARGNYYFRLAADKSSSQLLIFAVVLGLILALLCILICRYHSWMYPVYLLLMIALVVFGSKKLSFGSTAMFLLTAIIFFIGSTFRGYRGRTALLTGGIAAAALAIIVSAAGFQLLAQYLPASVTPVAQVKTYLNEKRYAGSASYQLPRGDLQEYEDSKNSEKVLTVKMSDQEPLYLKNYTGQIYNTVHNQWQTLAAQERHDSYPLQYWLARKGFDSFSQLSEAAGLGQQKVKTNEITIDNLKENSRSLFIPYGAELTRDQQAQMKDDQMLTGGALTGTRQVTYKTAENVLTKYSDYVAQFSKLKQASADPAADLTADQTYAVNEANYNHYVYQTYLSVTDAVTMIAQNTESGTTHEYYEKAEQTIRDYLSRHQLNAEENKKTKAYATPDNFIDLVIKGQYKLRYDVEFATFAAQMYRAMGIPARYTEGYLVTPQAVKDSKGNTITVRSSDAHAWVEIYQDGVGWVPKEFTPAYQNVMPSPAAAKGLAADTQTQASEQGDAADGQKQSQGEHVADQKMQENQANLQKAKQTHLKLAAFMIGGILLLALVTAVIVTLCRLRRRQELLKAQLSDDNNLTAARRYFNLIQRLLLFEGIHLDQGSLYCYEAQLTEMYSDQYGQHYHQAVKELQQSIAGGDSLSAEARKNVEKLYRATKRRVIDGQKWQIRFKRKWSVLKKPVM